MKVFRCLVCGDPYLGKNKPTNCPFCGAHQNLIVLVHEYKENKDLSTEKSRANLEQALEIEISNTQFYRAAMEIGDDEPTKQMFRALAKVEAEHGSTICKWLKIDKPAALSEMGTANDTALANVEESKKREERASGFYTQAAGEAMEKGVAWFFRALAEVERDHLELDKQAVARLTIMG
ncbi:MAG: ferritin [Actinobacteria bacterium]|jgi:rubrerythrin|nr:MAG: ferritin [Actinomycetota bacterium]